MCPAGIDSAILDVDVRRDGAHYVVSLEGELDLSSAPLLEARLAELEGLVSCVVDLHGLGFIDLLLGSCIPTHMTDTLEQTPALLFLGSLWLAIFFGFNGVSKEKPALFLDPLASHFRGGESDLRRSTGGHG